MNSQERVAQLTPEAAASPQHPVTPLAARLARCRGVNLSQVSASGERIRRQCVDNDLAGQAAPMAAALAATRAVATPAARRLARENQMLPRSDPRRRVQAADVAAALKPPVSSAPVIVGGDKLSSYLPI